MVVDASSNIRHTTLIMKQDRDMTGTVGVSRPIVPSSKLVLRRPIKLELDSIAKPNIGADGGSQTERLPRIPSPKRHKPTTAPQSSSRNPLKPQQHDLPVHLSSFLTSRRRGPSHGGVRTLIPKKIDSGIGSSRSKQFLVSKVVRRGERGVPQAQSQLMLTLREWDYGTRHTRHDILEDFISQNRHKTGPELDAEFGNAASLLLMRIISWIRLTYMFGDSASLPLQALSLFIMSSDGTTFLQEFIQTGGFMTIVELLTLEHILDEDKQVSMQLLGAMSEKGRHYKEMLCKFGVVDAILKASNESENERTQVHAQNLLGKLSVGNPDYQVSLFRDLLTFSTTPNTHAQRMAAAAVLIILNDDGEVSRMVMDRFRTQLIEMEDMLLDMISQLLESSSYVVHHELEKLIETLAGMERYHEALFEMMVNLLKGVDDDNDDTDDAKSKYVVRQKKGYRRDPEGYLSECNAAKQISVVVDKSDTAVDLFEEGQYYLALMKCLCHRGSASLRVSSGMALSNIMKRSAITAHAVKDLLGESLFEKFEKDAQLVCHYLPQEQMVLFRKKVVRMAAGMWNLQDQEPDDALAAKKIEDAPKSVEQRALDAIAALKIT